MAATLLFLRRPLYSSLTTPVSLCLGASTTLLLTSQLSPLLRSRLAYCESPLSASTSASLSEPFQNYTRDAKVPIFVNGRPNPAAYRQISAGSIAGLVGGVAVSYFSKTLALVFGLAVFGIQYLANKGINVIPTGKFQQYVKGIDLRSAIEDNAAFKLSFGMTFALASLAEF